MHAVLNLHGLYQKVYLAESEYPTVLLVVWPASLSLSPHRFVLHHHPRIIYQYGLDLHLQVTLQPS